MINQAETPYTNEQETGKLVKEIVKAAFDAVVSTMGPNGKLALIIDVNQPVVTKDGVRVAKALDFNDIRKNSIANLITSAAIKTDDIVGDGTTTTVMIIRNLFDAFDDGMNFHTSRIVDELVAETKTILEGLVSEVTPEDPRFEQMIRTTSNYQNDIADKVIELFRQYSTPNIKLRQGNGNLEDIIETNNKVWFEGRYAVTQLSFGTPRSAVEVENAHVVVVNNDIRDINPASIDLIAAHAFETQRPVFLFARSFDNQTFDTMIRANEIINRKFGGPANLWVVPFNIHSPGSLAAETLNDLATLLGVTPYTNLDGITKEALEGAMITEGFSLDMSGVSFDRKNKPIFDERAVSILDRIKPVHDGMNFSEKASYMGKFLLSRISRLQAENVTIIVSGMTKAEISERYYLFEDAIRVAASSIRFGVLPGIGWGFNQVADELHEKYSHLNDGSVEDKVMWEVIKRFTRAITGQYEYLMGESYNIGGENKYYDMVNLVSEDKPTRVFDNGSSAIVALEGGWSVVKRLRKLSCILGKSNTSYSR